MIYVWLQKHQTRNWLSKSNPLYSSMYSRLPRREAFGQYINRLVSAGCIKKIAHDQKKSMKSIVLTINIIKELDKVFDRYII